MVGGSLTEQLDNPELDVESSSPDLQTRRRRLQLRAATTRMRAAALGRDLELEDWGEPRGSPEGLAPPGFPRLDPGHPQAPGHAHCLPSPSPRISAQLSFLSSLILLALTSKVRSRQTSERVSILDFTVQCGRHQKHSYRTAGSFLEWAKVGEGGQPGGGGEMEKGCHWARSPRESLPEKQGMHIHFFLSPTVFVSRPPTPLPICWLLL